MRVYFIFFRCSYQTFEATGFLYWYLISGVESWIGSSNEHLVVYIFGMSLLWLKAVVVHIDLLPIQ